MNSYVQYLGGCIKSWVTFCCAPHLFCQFVFTRQFDHPTFPWENEQPEHHGLQLNQTSLHQVVLWTLLHAWQRVNSRSSSVLMYIRNLQLNLCTDFALVVPHVIFSALVNKKKRRKICPFSGCFILTRFNTTWFKNYFSCLEALRHLLSLFMWDYISNFQKQVLVQGWCVDDFCSGKTKMKLKQFEPEESEYFPSVLH